MLAKIDIFKMRIMIKKITILSLLVALCMCPDVAMAKKKKDKKENRQDPMVFFEPKIEEIDLPINDYYNQLNGEWNVVEINQLPVDLPSESRAYLYFDVQPTSRAGMIYGSTGRNSLNASYNIEGNKIKFDNIVTTKMDDGYFQHVESSMLKGLNDAASLALTQKGEEEYMEIKNKHRDVLIKLVRNNLEFMNGAWLVESINGDDVRHCDIRLVNDVDTKTVNIVSGSNIINGKIYLDPTIIHGIEYEDLKSTHYQWKYIDTETRLLIALEETMYCRGRGNSEIELYTKELDNTGGRNDLKDKVLVVLKKTELY